MISVVLADDHELVREGLVRILRESQGIEVAGVAQDGNQALEQARRLRPDVLLLDYCMPGPHGPELLGMLRRELPRTRCLCLSIHENVHYAVHALQGGAHGYLIKSAAVAELVEAIRTVHQGEVYLSRQIEQGVLQRMRRGGEGADALSARELELLRALAAGHPLRECARRLSISPSTASTYRARLLDKLGLETTGELIRFAVEHGLDR